jgi:hypothetical protein
MRRLGIVVCIAICFFSSSLRGVHAQQTTQSYDAFLKTVSDFHATANAALDAAAVKDTSDISKEATRVLKAAAQQNYDAYIAAFNTERAKPTATPADAQIAGTQAWIAKMNENSRTTRMYAGQQKTAYDRYAWEIQSANGLAYRIKQGYVVQGSAEAVSAVSTSSIQNAAAGNTNGASKVRKPPTACDLATGNLVACIDELFAAFIKITLLQIATGLLWLSSELMNYGIKFGILSFSTWAPDSLYPIWVIVRQIVSLGVVFAGLYLGFLYIIGREDVFGKYMGWLVIFALFVNFSYPVTRALIDVSNVVSLNLYSASVGSEALNPNSTATAGTTIINYFDFTSVERGVTDPDVTGSKSLGHTANALMAVVLAFWAAYVFFIATSIIIARTVVLVLLTVASPLLLIDSVVPKLGEAAMKLRKLFFEQLVVAPVFMLMLALTMKFMSIFKSGQIPGGTAITFFNMILMIAMLHIALKVTRDISGKVGTFATATMGKVGGFALGAATGGTGFLARGTLGAAAARMRDSRTMGKLQGSRTGRGLHMLTNSLAQSTYDVRNVGVVNKGMAKAGLTGIGGIGLQTGSSQTYDKRFAQKKETVAKKYESMQDAAARQKYYEQVSNGPLSRFASRLGIETGGRKIAKTLDVKELELQKKEGAALGAYVKGTPDDRKKMKLDAAAQNDTVLKEKFDRAQNYFDIIGAEELEKIKGMEHSKSDAGKRLETHEKDYKKRASEQNKKKLTHAKEGDEIVKLEKELTTAKQDTPEEKKAYEEKSKDLEDKKQAFAAGDLELRSMENETMAMKRELDTERASFEELKKNLDDARKSYATSMSATKVDLLGDLDSKSALTIIDNDPLTEIQQDNLDAIKKLEDELKNLEKGDAEYDTVRKQLQERREENKAVVEAYRKAIKERYMAKHYTASALDLELPEEEERETGQRFDTRHRGGSETSQFESKEYEVPAYLRRGAESVIPDRPASSGTAPTQPVPREDTSAGRIMTPEERGRMQEMFSFSGSGAPARVMTPEEVADMRTTFNASSFADTLRKKTSPRGGAAHTTPESFAERMRKNMTH